MTEQRRTRTWRLFDLVQGLDEPDSALRERARRELGFGAEQVRGFRIAHRAVDARRRGRERRLRFSVQVDLIVDADLRTPRLDRAERSGRARPAPEPGSFRLAGAPHPSIEGGRVCVVGSGPAGLFAAWVLATNGCAVDLIDRGASLRERSRSLATFLHSRVLDPETNLLFGEGGAGTYSDGKLYTRVDHELEVPILEVLVACGAPPDITFDARAHIGTDILHRMLPRLRGELESMGVRFHWGVRLDGLRVSGVSPHVVEAVVTSEGELGCDAVVLAPGHSARDTLRDLAAQGVAVEAKSFQLGVRVEHPQELIDVGRYGPGPDARRLGAAYYNLVCKAGGKLPEVHSFCMCPGGQVVASVNRAGLLCTNGMSNSRHSSPWANAALVTTLGPAEFGPGPFAGVELQEQIERLFFEAGGGDYTAPAQRVPDFLAGRETAQVGASSYKLGIVPARVDALLPPRVRDALARGIDRFGRQIRGFDGPAGLLVGIESRSSGPIRLPRDPETRRALGFSNLHPVGEGAGYAGGIMSAAIDGARSARKLLRYGVSSTG